MKYDLKAAAQETEENNKNSLLLQFAFKSSIIINVNFIAASMFMGSAKDSFKNTQTS